MRATIKGIIFIIEILFHIGISPKFFKEIIASYYVGRGQEQFQKKNYDEAFNILKPIADYDLQDGYVGIAQMYIGLMYFYGDGINKDIQLSRKYLNKAIENHNEYAKKFIKQLQSNNDIK